MKRSWLLVSLCLAISPGFAGPQAVEYAHFQELSRQVLSGSPRAFHRVLELAETTPPGERLEELAELSSRYVRLAPTEFLRAQLGSAGCFGVGFMGAKYVDDPLAVARERRLRKDALASVKDPVLSKIKLRCLKELAGS